MAHPQDSQTLTADYVQVRRDDAEWFLHARYYARTQRDEQAVKSLSERLGRLRAALNQGQG